MDEIGDFMTANILSVDHESSAQEAAQYMEAHQIGSLLVTEFGQYVGIVTDTDLARKVVSKGLNPDEIQVSEVMTSPLKTLDRFLPIEEASQFMKNNNIRHLVVTEMEKIVGILSVRDVVGYYAKSFRMQE